MATIKSYTDLQQSKKLAEILPVESADMHIISYQDDKGGYFDTALCYSKWDAIHTEGYYPCWSLAALLSVLPKRIKNYNILRIDINEKDFSIWYDEIGNGVNTELPDITMECPIDACYEMILKLHELNLL